LINQDDPEYELTEDTVNDMKELFLMFDTDQVISLFWRVFLLFIAVHNVVHNYCCVTVHKALTQKGV
jgi:hypothetical protein